MNSTNRAVSTANARTKRNGAAACAGVARHAGLAVWLLCALVTAAPAAEYLSPSALAVDPAGKVFVAQHTASQVDVVDVQGRAITRSIELPGAPTGLALSADGATLYVTTEGPGGQLLVIDAASGETRAAVSCGHTPMSPVVNADGARVYVCARFDNAVHAVDVRTGAIAGTVKVLREPIACVLSADGARLFVANHLPAGPADGDYTAAVISVVDLAAMTVAGEIALPNGSTGLRGLALSPDGRYAYATHILARYQLPTTQLERGWMNTNALTVIDTAAAARVNTVLLDSVDLGAANPWGVVCTADGAFICVASAGTHELSIINRAALHERLDKVAAGERINEVSQTPDDVPNDLSFLVGIRRRMPLVGKGPRAVAVAGNTAYVAEYFSDSLGVAPVTDDPYARADSFPLGPETPLTAERQGELFFNDAGLCFQHWQSCASCHPDGRADALNWDLLNDGIGNPKNTKSMLYALATPPAMISGVRDKAETAVRSGIRYIQFAVRPEEDAAAIDAYLSAMQPVSSPWLENGELSETARRGAEVFERAGCAACHSGPYFTDLQSYDVGTGTGREEGMAYDTPALNEVWRTAPYLHDGRSATMEDVLTTHNAEDRHGRTSGLTPDELRDLAAYLNSL